MTGVTPSSFEEFERAAALGNVVPVVRKVVSDFQQPVEAFERLSASATYSFLFESVEGGESLARHSFIGIEPEMIVRGRGKQTIIERAGAFETLEVSAPEFISDYFRTRTLSPADGLSLLAAGADRSLLKTLYEQAIENTARVERALKKGIPDENVRTTIANVKRPTDGGPFISNWDRESFERAVRTIKEHIFAGDC